MEQKVIETILLIEDNSVDVFINSRVIKQCGIDATIVSQPSGKSGLEYLSSSDTFPQLILLDIRMPEMDGFEFLEEFQKFSEEQRQNTRVVLLSSSIDPLDYERATQIPAVLGFIPKPLTKEKIHPLLTT